MRIPVSLDDLERSQVTKILVRPAVTKIARKLVKMWHCDLSLMQAQTTVAKLFGYRDSHDMRSCAGQTTTSEIQFPLTAASIRESLAWRLWRLYGISPSNAHAISANLPIEQLQCLNQRKDEVPLFFMDEFGSILTPHWHIQSGKFIECGAPPYEFAVMRDKRVFRFRALEEHFDKLPVHHEFDLKTEDRYARLPDNAVMGAFIAGELVPAAFTDIVTAVRDDYVMPDRFAVRWIYTSKGECVGRLLENTAVGGFAPELFAVAGQGVTDAVVTLLTGGAIASTRTEGGNAGAGVQLYVRKFDGPKGIGDVDKEGMVVDVTSLVPIAGGARCVLHNGRLHLVGDSFVEGAQAYVRARDWINAGDIPATLAGEGVLADYMGEAAGDVASCSQDAVPSSALALHVAVKAQIALCGREAMRRFSEPSGIEELVQFVLRTAVPPVVTRHYEDKLEESLPEHLQDGEPHDLEDEGDYQRERAHELERLDADGAAIHQLIPALSEYSRRALGMILLSNYGEYPRGRYRWSVSVPQIGEKERIARFMCGFAAQAIALSTGRAGDMSQAGAHSEDDVLLPVCARVLDGKTALEAAHAEMRDLALFIKRVGQQNDALRELEAWRRRETERAEMRRVENFLYVGKPVSATRPEDVFAKMARMSRSINTVPASINLSQAK